MIVIRWPRGVKHGTRNRIQKVENGILENTQINFVLSVLSKQNTTLQNKSENTTLDIDCVSGYVLFPVTVFLVTQGSPYILYFNHDVKNRGPSPK